MNFWWGLFKLTVWEELCILKMSLQAVCYRPIIPCLFERLNNFKKIKLRTISLRFLPFCRCSVLLCPQIVHLRSQPEFGVLLPLSASRSLWFVPAILFWKIPLVLATFPEVLSHCLHFIRSGVSESATKFHWSDVPVVMRGFIVPNKEVIWLFSHWWVSSVNIWKALQC